MRLSPPLRVALILLAFVPRASSHEGIHGRLERLDAELLHAESPVLLVERGNLHRLHGEWMRALADFARARELDPDVRGAHLGRARTLSSIGAADAALVHVEHHLAQEPEDARAIAFQAELLLMIAAPERAAHAYERAIDLTEAPSPELYLGHARALVELGDVSEALARLEAALDELGPVPGLALYSVDLCVVTGRFDDALDLLDELAARSSRRESWLARRGEVLLAADRPDAARTAFREARLAIADLPAKYRRTRAVLELDARLRTLLDRGKKP